MRYIILEVNRTEKIFYILYNGKKQGIAMSNRFAKIFLEYLAPQVMVEFKINAKKRKLDGKSVYVLESFTYIKNLKTKKVIYDLALLKSQMRQVINGFNTFLFLDFEMTMPGYHPRGFIPEIIEAGFLLENSHQVKEVGNYLLRPLSDSSINKRTRKFLNIDLDNFMANAVDFQIFYDHLKEILETHQPKIVVWGRNDMLVLHQSYQLYKLPPLTDETSFIDLMKLHKDYFSIKDDVGLFKAYQVYYGASNLKQFHKADIDALVTKKIFEAFVYHINQD